MVGLYTCFNKTQQYGLASIKPKKIRTKIVHEFFLYACVESGQTCTRSICHTYKTKTNEKEDQMVKT